MDHPKIVFDAITFDDVPRQPGAFLSQEERTKRLIAGLRRGGVRQAAFFVNPGFLANPERAGGEERIARYVRAGHVLANHSFSHPALSAVYAAVVLMRYTTWSRSEINDPGVAA